MEVWRARYLHTSTPPYLHKERILDSSNDKYYKLRHSTAHLMAQAVGDLFPGVKYAIGPPIEDGFYYDFDSPEPIKEEDLPRIEERMKFYASKDLKLERKEMDRLQSVEFCKKLDQPYKVQL